MSSGRLVLLNGPSSSGKTTIAKAVVGRLRTPWLVLPVDLFHNIRSRPDAHLTDRQWEDVFHRTRAAYHRALVGAAACGCDVLGDHVLSEPWRLDDLLRLSVGLDSTHALIVAARAMDALGRPRSDVLAFTMPGFATGDTSRSLATRLAAALGVTFEEIDIKPAAEQLLKDIDHPAADGGTTYDVTYENVQAGLRYDYLFRLANQRGGIVVGTGDLSELALGWCTYGVGDQMSHYNVNAGVPKTLIQHLIRWVIDSGQLDGDADAVLGEVLDQEITPELIPAVEGQTAQSITGVNV